MNSKRNKEIKEMADDIGHKEDFQLKQSKISPLGIINKKETEKLRAAAEIIATKKLVIPKCFTIPTNGRIFVIDVSGSEMRTPGGLILPPTMLQKKDDSMEGAKRYFVVCWAEDIPEEIKKYLCVGIEVNPFLPEHAEEWDLPRVIDWQGDNIFKVIHYTELAGVSSVKPEEIKE